MRPGNSGTSAHDQKPDPLSSIPTSVVPMKKIKSSEIYINTAFLSFESTKELLDCRVDKTKITGIASIGVSSTAVSGSPPSFDRVTWTPQLHSQTSFDLTGLLGSRRIMSQCRQPFVSSRHSPRNIR
jgi:hypothetical protein